jgi:hypothetical protein
VSGSRDGEERDHGCAISSRPSRVRCSFSAASSLAR